VGQKIKVAREAKDLTQEELGKITGLAEQHISVIERGIKTPTLKTFVNIANALHINADALLVDVLDTSVEVESNWLSQEIKELPVEEQKKVLKVIHVLTSGKMDM
jgi:transcriptional regulator with XRE-family HTH domain